MPLRRLVTAPVVALVATLLVGAVIDSGQRTRASQLRVPVPVTDDVELAAERLRIAATLRAAGSCARGRGCASSEDAAMLRAAARRIELWPAAARFEPARTSLQAQLTAEAAVLDQRAAMAVDHAVSSREQERLAQLERAALRASRRALDAQLALDLLTRDEHAERLAQQLQDDSSG